MDKKLYIMPSIMVENMDDELFIATSVQVDNEAAVFVADTKERQTVDFSDSESIW